MVPYSAAGAAIGPPSSWLVAVSITETLSEALLAT
jgi:hypothetical protein